MRSQLKRKREEEKEGKEEGSKTKQLSISVVPRVLLAMCLSHLTGSDRQSASLVCKMWCLVEKDRDAWPNNITVRRLENDAWNKQLTLRLARKRFDAVTIMVSQDGMGLLHEANCSALLQNVKVKRLHLHGTSTLSFLQGMAFVAELQHLWCEHYRGATPFVLQTMPALQSLSLVTALFNQNGVWHSWAAIDVLFSVCRFPSIGGCLSISDQIQHDHDLPN